MTIQINPREVAAEALFRIETEGAYNNRILHTLLRQNGAMPQTDKAFVTELVNGTLRQIYYIDHVLSVFSKTPIKKIKPWLLAVMRTASYQILFLQVPDPAACNEAVKLAKLRGYSALSGYVNATLRNIAGKKDEIPLPQEGTAEYLSIRYSHPLWLIKMWLSKQSYPFVEALCRANNQAPDVSIRINPLRTKKEELKKELQQANISVQEGVFSAEALHLSKVSDIGKLTPFLEGKFHVQDESAQLAALVLGAKPGETILDVCAAPGGKSFLLAQQMQNTGLVVSCDLYPHKIDLIREGAARLGLSCIQAKLRDACEAKEAEKEAFDRVIVDAPCSGLGLLRKKADIRLHKDGSVIDTLVPLQRQILLASAECVKPGGTLLYSTCTLCRKENEAMVAWFLQQRSDFLAEDLTDFLPEGQWNESCKEGYVTLYPHIHGTDGFFIARLRRKER